MNPVLTIDPEFEAKCPPLTGDELSQLEENILEEGLVLMPLIVWNDTIVDGHNRYRIAQAHPGIGFRTHEKQFNNRYEALSWICKNQLGRRDLTPQQKKYLIGQRYEAEKNTHGGDRKSALRAEKAEKQETKMAAPFPCCQLFQVHGSELKPHPVCCLRQASVWRITHRVFSLASAKTRSIVPLRFL